MTEEIFKRLDIIGSKIQMGAGKTWEVLVKGAYAEGISDLCVGIILLALTAWYVR